MHSGDWWLFKSQMVSVSTSILKKSQAKVPHVCKTVMLGSDIRPMAAFVFTYCVSLFWDVQLLYWVDTFKIILFSTLISAIKQANT